MKLLGIASDAKTSKDVAHGWLTGVIYMAPYNLSGRQVCPKASAGCAAACLNTAGRGNMPHVQQARLRKTNLFFNDREFFRKKLMEELEGLQRRADRKRLRPCARLNGTSDIPYERVMPELFEAFPDFQFYDYTKRPGRVTPPNYHLTFSRSEENSKEAQAELARGVNVAVVFEERPDTWWDVPVINGDSSDLHFLDPTPRVVGLKAKGRARKDTSGFVVRGIE